jgi:hypothetical protein
VQSLKDQNNVAFVSVVKDTVTLCFCDGSYILLLDSGNLETRFPSNKEGTNTSYVLESKVEDAPLLTKGPTALLLNPSEYLYGDRHCQRIIHVLLREQYSLYYLSNQYVDLSFLKHNLTSDIVYMNTHAGYWDVNGDQKEDTVVIATGEYWTDETETKYAFEYENHMIVEGMVGDQSFVCFTPAFIEYYYDPEEMPDSLIYMATCDATYDDSMAQPFLNAGAAAYMGWTQHTVFWTNSLTSVLSFRLFARGFTVKQVSCLLRSGGLYNFLLGSRLSFFGDGDHRIPT